MEMWYKWNSDVNGNWDLSFQIYDTDKNVSIHLLFGLVQDSAMLVRDRGCVDV